ncbi:aspartate-semialdehyde dehydrogenase [Candidatus Portiera aleyrodidarum]|uniref:Aspartate-semialdehyde dehydrogenase n=1 Tax=Candidatus Portiera aleyrodidarum TaxID=91844 RepID=A0A8D9JS57_9GAMM|nr:aspartate-semialdehyde dehydrogenase [Candidatus Portiera aleyrodidarum]CEI58600.1 Aspartate-semialdehyde dehydrogenase [Candidatus Portiera aleyrodidarum]
MLKIGFVGWRGMVGSVLIQRMIEENDFNYIEPIFFSTTKFGQICPIFGTNIQDAYDINKLKKLNVIITCQGGDYTDRVYNSLRASGWKGYWVDSSSKLRMDRNSIIVLDPININVIEQSLYFGIKNFIGGNCTVSLMLLSLGGLFKHNLIEWINSMTYQAASGAGSKHMIELLNQMRILGNIVNNKNHAKSILEIDSKITKYMSKLPIKNFGAPLAGSLIPWIDKKIDNGQTKEEWKGNVETNKILGFYPNTIKIDGICVRIGAMRCHSQAFIIKLKKDIPINEIESILKEHNPWVKVIKNDINYSLKKLTPAAVTGTMSIPIGRIRKLSMGKKYISAFTVGDQLLWGAAEPIRRMLKILVMS